MACGACSKARVRRKQALERRRAAAAQKEADKIARAAAAQAKLRASAPAVKPEEIIPELKDSAE